MSVHLNKEIRRLKELMTGLCTKVETSMTKALAAVMNHDKKLAAEIVANDREIDILEIKIEEECLKILALHQPVAIDLRYVIACLKMNNELERIGDLSANIAKGIMEIPDAKDVSDVETSNLRLMMHEAQKMLKDSLDALFELDINLAFEVCRNDDIVDDLNRKMHLEIAKCIRNNPENVEYYMRILFISRNIERIADYTTNLSEDIIYMIDGNIIRHGNEMEKKIRTGGQNG